MIRLTAFSKLVFMNRKDLLATTHEDVKRGFKLQNHCGNLFFCPLQKMAKIHQIFTLLFFKTNIHFNVSSLISKYSKLNFFSSLEMQTRLKQKKVY